MGSHIWGHIGVHVRFHNYEFLADSDHDHSNGVPSSYDYLLGIGFGITLYQ